MSLFMKRAFWLLQLPPLFWLWLMPLTLPPALVFNASDKLGHLVVFAGLTLTGLYIWPRRALLVSLLCMGPFVEALQALTPYRSPEVMDVVADTLGVALGLMVFIGLARWRK